MVQGVGPGFALDIFVNPGLDISHKLCYTHNMLETNAQGLKWCPSCQDFQEVKRFGRDKSRKDGLTVWCRPCRNKKQNAGLVAEEAALVQARHDGFALGIQKAVDLLDAWPEVDPQGQIAQAVERLIYREERFR